MKEVVFVTGNPKKAEHMARLLGFPLSHRGLDLVEIQSTNLEEIASEKAKQAYDVIKKPIIVEDVALEFEAFNGLPGPFIKFFLDKLGSDGICRILDGQSRKATARCVIAFYDGTSLQTFEGHHDGEISKRPIGSEGYGWDNLFIPERYDTTRANLSASDQDKVYKIIKPLDELKRFLENY